MDRLAMIFTMLLTASACRAEPASTASETAPGEGTLRAEAVGSVDGDEVTAAERCSEQSVRSTVERFVEAYSSGEPDLADRFFAGEDRYQWYSEPPDRLNDEAFDRATLDLYLARRHAEGDRLQIVELNYTGHRVEDQTGHFDFVVRRDDVDDVIGKGAVDCLSGGIMVWSLGPNPGPTGT